MISISLMALGVVFTLSRGAMIAVLGATVAFLLGLAWLGRARWSATLGVVLALAIVAGAAWIGTQPLSARLRAAGADAGYRWLQSVTSIPMIADFPVLGVGLGAYGDVYYRYQPLALKPGKDRYNHAHNDLLQFVIEVGLAGAALAAWALWRVTRDLVGAHLAGRAPCPVAAARQTEPRRKDAASVALGLGGLAGVLTLLLHSAFDFGARIPANGVLAAACLGIATVSLHTRFGSDSRRHLERVRELAPGRLPRLALAGGGLVLALFAAPVIVSPALVEATLAGATEADALARADAAVRRDPADVRALRARAQHRLEDAAALVTGKRAPRAAGGATREALDRARGAVEDLVAAVRLVPTDPSLHERLGWAHATVASLEGAAKADHDRAALAHLRRAILLAPENAHLREALADYALRQDDAMLDVGLGAVREAVQRDPELLPRQVDRLIWLALPWDHWKSIIPDTALDLLRLAAVLEDRLKLAEAETLYRDARAKAAPPDEALVRWMYSRYLVQAGRGEMALAELEAGLRREPENPELQLARAQALSGRDAAAARAAFHAALRAAEARGTASAFPQTERFLVSLIGERMAPGGPAPHRYHRALAHHLTDRGEWEPALREWERLETVWTLDASGAFAMGRALDGLGARDRALAAYRKAIALEPGSARFRQRLAQTLWDSGQYMQAVEEWKVITAAQPANVEARLALARAYTRFGARSEAVQQYEAVLRTMGDHGEAREGLARLGPGIRTR